MSLAPPASAGSFFSVTGWGIGLDYHYIEWFALETNRDHSVIFEIAPKNALHFGLVAQRLKHLPGM